jgi:hypothetical protein
MVRVEVAIERIQPITADWPLLFLNSARHHNPITNTDYRRGPTPSVSVHGDVVALFRKIDPLTPASPSISDTDDEVCNHVLCSATIAVLDSPQGRLCSNDPFCDNVRHSPSQSCGCCSKERHK